MPVNNPPRYIQTGVHDAEGDRQLLYELFGRSSVVLNVPTATTGYFAVTESATPGMSVDISPGKAFVDGTEDSNQGGYFISGDLTETRIINNGDATYDRIDIVVAQVEDAEYSGSINAWKLSVVEGQPTASPAPPSAPANSIILAEVSVAQSEETSILNADITDKRPSVVYLPGTTSGVWLAHTPTWTNFTDTDATVNCRWTRIGDTVHYHGTVTFGAGTAVTGTLGVDLPVNSDTTGGRYGVGSLFMNEAGVKSRVGSIVINAADRADFYSADGLADGVVDATEPFTWGNGDEFAWTITYEA